MPITSGCSFSPIITTCFPSSQARAAIFLNFFYKRAGNVRQLNALLFNALYFRRNAVGAYYNRMGAGVLKRLRLPSPPCPPGASNEFIMYYRAESAYRKTLLRAPLRLLHGPAHSKAKPALSASITFIAPYPPPAGRSCARKKLVCNLLQHVLLKPALLIILIFYRLAYLKNIAPEYQGRRVNITGIISDLALSAIKAMPENISPRSITGFA